MAALFLGCATADGADESDEPGESDAVAETSQAVVSTIRIAGHVGVGRVGVAGVTVSLSGQSQATTRTDADGNYKFDVAPGSYSVNLSKSGATLSPNLFNQNSQTASVFLPTSCTAGCTIPASIIPERELVITDPGVVGVTATNLRADNDANGHWSMRFLMDQMAGVGQDTAAFTRGWLGALTGGGTVNGFAVDQRIGAPLGFSFNQNGVPNWSQVVLKLVAIVNRTDLHSTGQGELRFVFGANTPTGGITVIFEYGLPATRTRQGWASQFHALASMVPGTDAYNSALQAITDQVVVANTSPTRPNGSSINQVRVNEIALRTDTSPNWQLHEFRLPANGSLVLSPTAQTPDDSANTSGSAQNNALASFINTNLVDLQAGFATIPNSLIGGQSSEILQPGTITPIPTWQNFAATATMTSAQKAAFELGRHAFAGATCNGCHFSEVNGSSAGTQNTGIFYQISPSGTLSPLMTSVEIPRRQIFAQQLLACSGSTCAAGAEPMLP